MKVLFIIDRMGAGGKERQLVELLKGLSRTKTISSQLIVLSTEIHYQELLGLDIQIHCIKRSSKIDIKALNRVYHICKSFKPDIIHSWESIASFYVLPAARWLGIKLINSIIRNAPLEVNRLGQAWIRTRLLLYFSDLTVANSKAGLKSYRIPRNKSHYIYNGFDFRRVNAVANSEITRSKFNIFQPKVVGMVGKFTDKKDYETFLLAATEILKNRSDVDFVTVGAGKYFNSYRTTFKNDNIHFLGNQQSVESIVNIFDIGVLATYTEGISNSIMEYMALAKPVIATEGGGTCELLVDEETGFLVNRKDVEDLVYRIELLLDDPELAQNMGQAGKQRLLKEFDLQKLTEQMWQLYQRLTNSH